MTNHANSMRVRTQRAAPGGGGRGHHELSVQVVARPSSGLRLHLNENTAGCSPKVLAAIRGVSREDVAFYPDYDDGGQADGGADRRRRGPARADERARRGHPGADDRGAARSRQRAPGGDRRRARFRHVRARPPTASAHASSKCRPAPISRFPPRRDRGGDAADSTASSSPAPTTRPGSRFRTRTSNASPAPRRTSASSSTRPTSTSAAAASSATRGSRRCRMSSSAGRSRRPTDLPASGRVRSIGEASALAAVRRRRAPVQHQRLRRGGAHGGARGRRVLRLVSRPGARVQGTALRRARSGRYPVLAQRRQLRARALRRPRPRGRSRDSRRAASTSATSRRTRRARAACASPPGVVEHTQACIRALEEVL